MKQDWLFKSDASICNFRTAGVLVQSGKLLVQRDAGGTEYALPGGHVQVGETSAETLVREFQEETGAGIAPGRLLWVEECFWNWGGKMAHTICFYYEVTLHNEADIPDCGEFVSQKDNCDVLLGWVPVERVKELTIYPSFLKEKLFDMKEYPEHFVTRE